jgi:hypothetical protein
MSKASGTVAYKELDNKWLRFTKYGIGIGVAGFALFFVSFALIGTSQPPDGATGTASFASVGLFGFASFCVVGGSILVALSIWEDKKHLNKKTGRSAVNNPIALWIYVYFSLYVYPLYYLSKRKSKYQDTPTVSESAQSDQDTNIEFETEPTQQESESTVSIQQERDDDTVGTDDTEDTIFCVGCGHELQADAEFCTSCGNSLP